MERTALCLVVSVKTPAGVKTGLKCNIVFHYKGWRVTSAKVELTNVTSGRKTLLLPENEPWYDGREIHSGEELKRWADAAKSKINLLDDATFYGTLADAWGWVPQQIDSPVYELAKRGLAPSQIVALADGRLVRVASGGYEDMSSPAEIMANAF